MSAWRAMLAALCLVAAAPERAHAAPTPCLQAQKSSERAAQLVALLKSDEPQKRNEGYMGLLREKPPEAVELVVADIAKWSVPAQDSGLNALSLYPDELKLPALRKLLASKAPLVELGAAAWLVRVGETQHVPHIVGPLKQKDLPGATRRMLLGRLWGVRDPQVLAQVRAMAEPGEEAATAGEALWTLLVAEDGGMQRRAAELWQDPRTAAWKAQLGAYLVACGDPRAGDALAGELRTNPASVWTMSRFLDKAPSLPPPLLAALAELAKGADQGHAIAALGLLGTFGEAKQLETVGELLSSPSVQLAKAALQALLKRVDWLPKGKLKGMLSSPDPELAIAAADALRRMDDHSGLERVLQLAAQDGPQRYAAVTALGAYRLPRCIPALLDAMEAQDQPVRTQAGQGVASTLQAMHPYRRFDLAAAGWNAGGAPAERAAALAKLRAWWAKEAQPPPTRK